MPNDEPHSIAPPSSPETQDWRELAEAAKNEQDPAKLLAIVQQLNRALTATERRHAPIASDAPHPPPDTDKPEA